MGGPFEVIGFGFVADHFLLEDNELDKGDYHYFLDTVVMKLIILFKFFNFIDYFLHLLVDTDQIGLH